VAGRWDGTRPTLAERSRADPGTPPPSEPEPQRPRPVTTRHCWISGLPELAGRHAGLLVEWRREPGRTEWSARVVYAYEDAGGPVLVEAWVAAAHLSPAR
jgi:hypothetical protein